MKNYDNKNLVNLEHISEDARGMLVKVASFAHLPYNKRVHDEEYLNLFQDFQKETHYQYLAEESEPIGKSFDRFEVAAKRMQRRLKTLTYKTPDGADYDTKDGSAFDELEMKRKLYQELKL